MHFGRLDGDRIGAREITRSCRLATGRRGGTLGLSQVGIEKPGHERDACMMLHLERRALATSGDSRRIVLRDGIRYGHVLDPKTGWPVSHAPRPVTVAASSCTEAEMLSTFAILHGAKARQFLNEQGVRHWILE
ncbi:MAG: FAD:protein FMN transferase [Steroidobacteraceae bacterium]